MKYLIRIGASLFAAMLALAPMAALTQTSPNLTYRQVPTNGQWNSYFAGKQDVLGFTPLNSAGGVLTGRLVTAPPSSTTSGLNLTPGSTPGSPANGDLWVTSLGIFAQINGATINLTGAASTSFAGTSPITVTFPSGVVTYACATCGLTGSPLSQFAATTSAQLAGIISDETGSGSLVFGTSPTLATPHIASIVNTGTLTLPTLTDTLLGRTTTDTLTNKTLASSTDVLGGVTMTLGSDANGDLYCRSGGVLTRIAGGASASLLTSGGPTVCPTWAAAPGGGNVSNTLTPLANQVAQWTNATTIQGVNLVSLLIGGAGVTITGTTTATISAQATSILMGGSGNANLSNTTTSYSWNSNECVSATACQQPIATSGTISQLQVFLTSAPGSGKSYTFFLMKNGAATSVTCAVVSTAQTCSDITDSVTVAANDLLQMQSLTPAGTPAAAGLAFSLQFVH